MDESCREDLHNLPFGPLTPDSYDRLSNSFYDASQTKLHSIAVERGVIPGEASRRRFAERLARRQAERCPEGIISVEDFDDKS